MRFIFRLLGNRLKSRTARNEAALSYLKSDVALDIALTAIFALTKESLAKTGADSAAKAEAAAAAAARSAQSALDAAKHGVHPGGKGGQKRNEQPLGSGDWQEEGWRKGAKAPRQPVKKPAVFAF